MPTTLNDLFISVIKINIQNNNIRQILSALYLTNKIDISNELARHPFHT